MKHLLSLLRYKGVSALAVRVLVIVVFAPMCCLGQGRITFSNGGAANLVTNGATGQPVQIGSTFQAAVYFAPDGVVEEAQFVQLGPSAGFYMPGLFAGGTREVPGVDQGAYAMFQVRAWESAFGATYEEAVSNPNPQGGRLALAGKTGIMRVQPGWDTRPSASLVGNNVEAVVGAPLSAGFILTVVPEPATTLLCLIGMAGLAVYAWRRLL
jgi:hypothetical protein